MDGRVRRHFHGVLQRKAGTAESTVFLLVLSAARLSVLFVVVLDGIIEATGQEAERWRR